MNPAALAHPIRPSALRLAVAVLVLACSLAAGGAAAPLAPSPTADPDAPAVAPAPVPRADVARHLADIGRRLEAAGSERAAPGGALAVTAEPEFDEVGGDDVLAAIEDSIRAIAAPSMDIANNGDIFVAVQVEVPDDYEIHVYRSQDGGRTWQLWGTLADPATDSQFHEPSLCVAEGNVDRLFVAFRHDRPAATASIDVAYSDPSLPAAAFTTLTVMDSTDVSFGHPSIRSDEEASSGYYVYVAAQGGGSDSQGIWIARSRFQGDPWEDMYCIASLPAASQRLYIEPQITYGNNCQVHCVWRFLALDGSADQAIRYRRATNCAGFGLEDWEPVVYLTPNNNGYHESVASVAASHTTNTALVSYNVRSVTGVREGVHIQASYDAGVTWDPADLQELPDDEYSIHLIAKPNGAGFVHFGGQGRHDNFGFEKSPDVEPVSWSPHQSFQDRLYDTNAAYNAGRVGACDPTRADQVAVVWPVCVDGVKDSLYFDAEWRGGPGFPNLEPGFPLALAAGVRSPLGICELDGDPQSEIVFGDVDGYIQARHHDGTSLSGWPIDIGDIAPDSPVAVGDLDGDGVNEVVCGNTAGVVHAFRADGSPFPGWPVDTGYPDSVYVSIGALTPVSHRQVVACVSNRIFLLSGAGAVQPPFPIKSGGEIRTSAAIGDVNDDGSNEIVMLQYQFMNVITGAGGVRRSATSSPWASRSPTRPRSPTSTATATWRSRPRPTRAISTC